MKTWKLVSGILSIVFCFITGFQSCAAGFVNTVEANGDTSGSSGILLTVLLLAGGIVSIAARSNKKGGNIALIVLFGLAAIVGFVGAGGTYGDLIVWAAWCLICAILAIISLVKSNKTA